MLAIIFTPAAAAELVYAQDWYKVESPGLGKRFREAVDVLTARMSRSPEQFPVVFKAVRRARLRRFPYSVYFVVEEDAFFVIACFHASRNPSRWQRRT